MRTPATHPRSSGRSTIRLALSCAAVGAVIAFLIFQFVRDEAHVGALKPLTPGSDSAHADEGAKTRVAVDPLNSRIQGGGARPTEARAKSDVPRVEGRVHARGGLGIANARVNIELVTGDESRALGFTTTGPDGAYSLDVPHLTQWPAPPGDVRVQADASHFRPGRRTLPLAAVHDSNVVQLDVRLEQGERLTGRVVNGASKPVSGATVVLSVASTKDDVTTYPVVEELRTGSDGRFETGFTSSARYHVAARADGIGTAFVLDLELEAGVARNLGDLVLKGGAAITGTLTHASGEPAAEFELWAIDGSFANEPNGLALAVLKAPETERADGLAYAQAFTDAAGAFALGGLRPGQYALRSPDPHAILEPHQLRFEPGTSKLELKVMSSRLLVRVVDEHGSAVPGASVRLTELSTLTDGSYQAAGVRTQAVHGPLSIAAFVLDPETPVAVEAFTATRTSHEELVRLTQSEFTRELVLVLSNSSGEGRLNLDVRGADGRALTNLQVSVLSAVTQARHEELGSLETDAEGRLPPIPAGTYQLLVGFAPGTDRDHFPVRTSDPVVVKSGEITTLALRAKQGGRVAVELAVRSALPPGFDEPLPPNATPAQRSAAETRRRARFGTNISITPANGGSTRALHFQDPAGAGLVTEILPGETLVSEDLIEPGTYSLSIESLTFVATAAAAVRIDAGRSADVTLSVRVR